MGFRVLGFSLLIIIFITLMNLPSAYALHNASPSEFVQKSKFEEKEIFGSKIEGGGGHGSHGSSSHGNGNSGTPETRGGGAAVIPVYTAGAANKNHQTHHGAANCNLDKIRFSNMLMITLVYPLILLFLLI